MVDLSNFTNKKILSDVVAFVAKFFKKKKLLYYFNVKYF